MDLPVIAAVIGIIFFSYFISPKNERKQIRKDLKDVGNLFTKWLDRK